MKINKKILTILFLAVFTILNTSLNAQSSSKGKIYLYLNSNDAVASKIPVESTGEFDISSTENITYDLSRDLHLKHISGTLNINKDNYKLNAQVLSYEKLKPILNLNESNGNLEFKSINSRDLNSNDPKNKIEWIGKVSQLFITDKYGSNNLHIGLKTKNNLTPVQYTQILADVDQSLTHPSLATKDSDANHPFGQNLVDKDSNVLPNNYFYNEKYENGGLPKNTYQQLFDKFNIDINKVRQVDGRPFDPNKLVGQDGLFNVVQQNHGASHFRGVSFIHYVSDINVEEILVDKDTKTSLAQGKLKIDNFNKSIHTTWLNPVKYLKDLQISLNSENKEGFNVNANVQSPYAKYTPFYYFDWNQNKLYIQLTKSNNSIKHHKKDDKKIVNNKTNENTALTPVQTAKPVENKVIENKHKKDEDKHKNTVNNNQVAHKEPAVTKEPTVQKQNAVTNHHNEHLNNNQQKSVDSNKQTHNEKTNNLHTNNIKPTKNTSNSSKIVVDNKTAQSAIDFVRGASH